MTAVQSNYDYVHVTIPVKGFLSLSCGTMRLDSHSKYTAKANKGVFTRHTMEIYFNWPGQLPDLDPTEQVFHLLDIHSLILTVNILIIKLSLY